jgi:hypothetical protein
MANVELELQGAIVTRLKADSAVAALVNGRVYDSVPTSAAFPYVSIGPVDSNQDDADCITSLEVAQQIDCWSRAAGFPECKKIADAVRAALHGYEPDLATNAIVFFEHRTTRITRDPDGITSHGILGFEAAIERQ